MYRHWLLNQSGNRGTLVSSTGPTRYQLPAKLKGMQVTASENHPEWNSRASGNNTKDIGGPFRTERRFIESSHSDVTIQNKEWSQSLSRFIAEAEYRGPMLPLWPDDPLVSYPVALESTDNLLNALGTEAIAKVKPTNSVADVATALAEIIREGLPRLVGTALWKSKTQAAVRNTGGEFLNIEFGWKPLVNDIVKFGEAVRSADKVMRQYERDSGRVVRRRFNFPPVQTSTVTTLKTGVLPFTATSSSTLRGSYPFPSESKVILIEETRRERWFSGAFTYYLPPLSQEPAMKWWTSRANKLYGTQLTPEVLWNLAPWSWAVDWFSNVGDVVSNLTDWSKDGLVLRYGYIMEHSVSRRIYTYVGANTGYPGGNVPANLILTHEVKKRLPATPFGFGLTFGGFSPRQIAIITALGMSRSG